MSADFWPGWASIVRSRNSETLVRQRDVSPGGDTRVPMRQGVSATSDRSRLQEMEGSVCFTVVTARILGHTAPCSKENP